MDPVVTTSILKSDAVDKAADLLHKLFGPMTEEVGLLLGDKVRGFRQKNLTETVQKSVGILQDAGLEPKPVPPRLLLPIIESCSVEDNETLQDLWAGLLASASQQSDAMSPSFIETLKQLTPSEAKFLEKLFTELDTPLSDRFLRMSIHPYWFTARDGAPKDISADTFERLGLIRRDYKVNLGNTTKLNREAYDVSMLADAVASLEPELLRAFELTRYAIAFMDACHGPKPLPPQF